MITEIRSLSMTAENHNMLRRNFYFSDMKFVMVVLKRRFCNSDTKSNKSKLSKHSMYKHELVGLAQFRLNVFSSNE